MPPFPLFLFFFFNDTATTEIYTLSLHDALPIFLNSLLSVEPSTTSPDEVAVSCRPLAVRSEEHTSELQSRPHLVCRLLLEKKKKNRENQTTHSRDRPNRQADPRDHPRRAVLPPD